MVVTKVLVTCGYNLFQKLHSIYRDDPDSSYLIVNRGLCMFFGGTVRLDYFTLYCFKQGYALAQQGTRRWDMLCPFELCINNIFKGKMR